MSQQIRLTRRSVLEKGLTLSLAAVPLSFAQQRQRISPHETVSIDLNNDKISITYGRPSLKGRKMLGGENPYGKVWRLGADEATKLTVTTRTVIGNVFELAPGSYSLFAIPYPDHWTMIVNKVADQMGAFTYQQTDDVGRFDVPVQHLSSPVEEFTITLTKQAPNIAKATFAWGDVEVSTTLKAL